MSVPEYMKVATSDEVARHVGAHSRRHMVLTAVNILLTCGLAVLMVVWLAPTNVPQATPTGGWGAPQQKALAVKLQTDGMSDRAVDAFERYLSAYPVSSDEVARVCYVMGKIRMDQQRYDDALGHFYRVGIADAASPATEDTGRNIVTCLDRLGRSIDARYALDRQTALDKSARTQDVQSVMIAKIGDDTITQHDLDNEIQKLPREQQERFAKAENQREFLRQYVAQRLLFKKGLALAVDRQADVHERVAGLERQLVVQKLLESEVTKRVTIQSADVKLFYEARPELFSSPEQARVAAIVCTNRVDAETLLKAVLADAAGTTLFARAADEAAKRDALLAGDATPDGTVSGVWSEPSLAKAALAQKSGMVSNVVPVANGFAVVLVESWHPSAKRSFNEVQQQAEQMYRAQKEQQACDEIIEEMIKANRVQMYPERLTPHEPSTGAKKR